MNCYVISMQNSQRRDDFRQKFTGMQYSFYNAISEDSNLEFKNKIAKSIYGRNLRNGEIGCTLSHFNLIRKLVASKDEEWSLIIEDDAIPEINFFHFISEFEDKYLTTEPEVILLGHSKTRKKDLLIQRLKQPLRNYRSINGYAFGENRHISMCGTVSYLINKAAAEILADNEYPYWLADDWAMFQNMGLHIYHPKTPLIYEDLSYTSSTENDVIYHHNFFREPLKNVIHIIAGQYKFLNDSRKI
ncbi:TPA: glycosyltransferase family 25 protein [Citrobacter amalonaticus]|uniref:Glycosyltransferase family 25 protein n=1 Tax=Citrobacter amalonaticus TaxID=35703 RepID=A0A9C7QKL2_CITAM|nr:glycosyltransferase family 25 protein [Citrobacter amalonaticus]